MPDDGHATDHMPACAAELCELIAVGTPWERQGERPGIQDYQGMPTRAEALRWRRRIPAFRSAFDQARADSVAALVEEMRQIRDDDSIDARDKAVRLNSLQWELSRRDRAAWGDKVDMTLDAQVTVNLSDRLEQARRRAIGRTIDVTPSLAAVETGGRGG